MWAVAGWAEPQMAELPSIFAQGYSRALCLFVCWGPLQHKGFSQTCACIPWPSLSTPTILAQARLASCPDERQLTRFVCTCGTWPVLAPWAQLPTPPTPLLFPRGPWKSPCAQAWARCQDRHNGKSGVIVTASAKGFVRGPGGSGGAAVGAGSELRHI